MTEDKIKELTLGFINETILDVQKLLLDVYSSKELSNMFCDSVRYNIFSVYKTTVIDILTKANPYYSGIPNDSGNADGYKETLSYHISRLITQIEMILCFIKKADKRCLPKFNSSPLEISIANLKDVVEELEK